MEGALLYNLCVYIYIILKTVLPCEDVILRRLSE